MQLNAQEDEFKQKLADRIDTVVQAEMIDGFKGYALNELIEEQGNIFSDPQVLGRLRAQQEYKAYQDNLNNRKDLSEDKKIIFVKLIIIIMKINMMLQVKLLVVLNGNL